MSKTLESWLKDGSWKIRFVVSMVWRDPEKHAIDWYFCLTNVVGLAHKSKQTAHYFQNYMSNDCKIVISEMLEAYKTTGCKIPLKTHILVSYLDFFPENLLTVSDEHEGRFHQTMKKRYQVKLGFTMLVGL